MVEKKKILQFQERKQSYYFRCFNYSEHYYPCFVLLKTKLKLIYTKTYKGNPPSADLRYGEENSISPSTLIIAAIKGSLWISTLYIPPDVPKK